MSDDDLLNRIRGIVIATENRIKERLTLLTIFNIGAMWFMFDHFFGV